MACLQREVAARGSHGGEGRIRAARFRGRKSLEDFGAEVVAAAMIDRLVHHAEILALKGDSYRLKDRGLGRTTPTNTDD